MFEALRGRKLIELQQLSQSGRGYDDAASESDRRDFPTFRSGVGGTSAEAKGSSGRGPERHCWLLIC